MEGLLSFLLFAVIFYVMMRFGCGAHMVHGHHDARRAGEGAGREHVDPVCGKTVPPNEGYGKLHDGDLYRFCSRECLDAFEANPGSYVHRSEEAAP